MRFQARQLSVFWFRAGLFFICLKIFKIFFWKTKIS
jgi:hypothetical protein